MKVLTIVGARPQFVKAAVVSRAFQQAENVSEILVHTGQHYDEEMSNLFFDELEIRKPDYNLEVGSASNTEQTARILDSLEPVLKLEAPDLVVVYGDTNSTLAGALAASQMNIPVAHVEAGLRSFNRAMPEEKNRIVADHLSSLLFAPTQEAVDNLAREGITGDKVRLVGDVMYDAALYYSQRTNKIDNILEKLSVKTGQYVLATVHRAENTDFPERLRSIFEALMEIALDLPVVLPLHPRTRKQLQQENLLDKVEENLKVTLPVGYLHMVDLTKNAAVIATDSGGLQKEAYFFNTPCLTLRNETEWVELVKCGANKLTGHETSNIVSAFRNLDRSGQFDQKLYGDGDAASKIVAAIMQENQS